MDNTILNVALPSLVRDLGATNSQLQWIVDSYTLVFAGLLLTAGSLGDRFGRKGALRGRPRASSASARSPRPLARRANTLIATRAFMGIGGALIMPATLSLLTNVFRDPKERARAIAIWAGFSGLGVAIGPLIGGFLLEHFSWTLGVLGERPDRRSSPSSRGRFFVPDSKDPNGAAARPRRCGPARIVGLVALVWAIIEAPAKGWTSAARRWWRSSPAAVLLGGFVAVGAAHRPPDARHALLQEPAVQRRQRRHHAHVLRHVRLDVPHHASTGSS